MSIKKSTTDSGSVNRLKVIRKALKLSQAEFAISIGIKQSSYNEIETGKREPSLPILFSICYRFPISENWILTGAGEMWKEEKGVQLVDHELLEAVISAVEEYLDQVDGHLKPAKKAQLIAALYDISSAEEKHTVDRAKVIQLFKLAA